MPTNHKGIAYGAVGAGVLFVWSATQNRSLLSTIQDIIRGRQPQPGPAEASPAATAAQNQATINQATGNLGANNNGAAHNQAIAKKLAVAFGWDSGPQWDCLVETWNRESGWSNTAENPSGAYGIPQALPNTKLPLAGRPPSEGGTANATVQILWGLSYILARYGNPCNAWAHEQAYNWY